MCVDVVAQIDGFFAGKPREWALFEVLRARVRERYPQSVLRVMKTCISFDDPKPYLYVSFPSRKRYDGLWLSISLREAAAHPRIEMVVPVSKVRCTAHIHLREEAEIDDELLAMIASSHR